MIRAFLTLCVCTALLAGCGQPKQTVKTEDGATTVETTTADGDVSRMQAGANVQAPANLPDSAPIYPGLTLESVMSGSSDGKAGGMLVGSTPDAPDKVAAFYREKLKALSAANFTDMNMNGSFVLAAGEASGKATSVQISPREEGGSTVAITYSE